MRDAQDGQLHKPSLSVFSRNSDVEQAVVPESSSTRVPEEANESEEK